MADIFWASVFEENGRKLDTLIKRRKFPTSADTEQIKHNTEIKARTWIQPLPMSYLASVLTSVASDFYRRNPPLVLESTLFSSDEVGGLDRMEKRQQKPRRHINLKPLLRGLMALVRANETPARIRDVRILILLAKYQRRELMAKDLAARLNRLTVEFKDSDDHDVRRYASKGRTIAKLYAETSPVLRKVLRLCRLRR